MRYVMYTDGSANVHDQSGAWAYVIVDADTDTLVREDCGFVQPTTNNRMELQAVLEGLKQFRPDTALEIVSDSVYVVNCFKDHWYRSWIRNNWYATSGPVKNVDLWQALIGAWAVRKDCTTWTHIRGHRGNKWNEYVDQRCDQVRRAGVRKNPE